MALTLKMLFSHAVTRQYPEEKRPVQPGFRGSMPCRAGLTAPPAVWDAVSAPPSVPPSASRSTQVRGLTIPRSSTGTKWRS
ncbi:MAG: hypothetical protein MZU95_10090 [Desulfomicrobium escambiense]|nr:hypothetical protein [Desulfomicrobium escambiense]